MLKDVGFGMEIGQVARQLMYCPIQAQASLDPFRKEIRPRLSVKVYLSLSIWLKK